MDSKLVKGQKTQDITIECEGKGEAGIPVILRHPLWLQDG